MTKDSSNKIHYSIDDLSVMAAKGKREDYKVLMSSAEQSAFLCLSYLYKLYNVGGISREDAAKTKAQIAKRFEKDTLREEQLKSSIKAFADVIKRTSTANEEYRKNRCLENADKLCEAIDGVPVFVQKEEEKQ